MVCWFVLKQAQKRVLKFVLLLSLCFQPLFADEKTASLFLDNQVYVNNLEYTGSVSQIRTGETFFGNHLTAGTQVEFIPPHFFRGGILTRMRFGDQKIDTVLPVFSIHTLFLEKKLELIAGSLNVRHKTDEFITDNNLFYIRPAELGLQTIANFSHFDGETWIDWQRTENNIHGEKFDAGLVTKFKSHGFFGKLQWHYIHIGGQLYSNPDPVQDDHSFALGGGYTINLRWINKLELSADKLNSLFVIRGKGRNSGNGYQAKILISPWNWNIFSTFWLGKKYYHEDGDLLYQANKYLQLGVMRTFQLSEGLDIAFDARAKMVNEKIVHSEGLLFSWNTAYPLFKWK